MTVSPDSAQPRPSFLDALAVYLKPRVLIVLFLGFSSGLPLALSGATHPQARASSSMVGASKPRRAKTLVAVSRNAFRRDSLGRLPAWTDP